MPKTTDAIYNLGYLRTPIPVRSLVGMSNIAKAWSNIPPLDPTINNELGGWTLLLGLYQPNSATKLRFVSSDFPGFFPFYLRSELTDRTTDTLTSTNWSPNSWTLLVDSLEDHILLKCVEKVIDGPGSKYLKSRLDLWTNHQRKDLLTCLSNELVQLVLGLDSSPVRDIIVEVLDNYSPWWRLVEGHGWRASLVHSNRASEFIFCIPREILALMLELNIITRGGYLQPQYEKKSFPLPFIQGHSGVREVLGVACSHGPPGEFCRSGVITTNYGLYVKTLTVGLSINLLHATTPIVYPVGAPSWFVRGYKTILRKFSADAKGTGVASGLYLCSSVPGAYTTFHKTRWVSRKLACIDSRGIKPYIGHPYRLTEEGLVSPQHVRRVSSLNSSGYAFPPKSKRTRRNPFSLKAHRVLRPEEVCNCIECRKHRTRSEKSGDVKVPSPVILESPTS